MSTATMSSQDTESRIKISIMLDLPRENDDVSIDYETRLFLPAPAAADVDIASVVLGEYGLLSAN